MKNPTSRKISMNKIVTIDGREILKECVVPINSLNGPKESFLVQHSFAIIVALSVVGGILIAVTR